jgi:hypothetical protein
MDCIAEIDDVSYCLFHEQVFVSNQHRADDPKSHEAGPTRLDRRHSFDPLHRYDRRRFWGLRELVQPELDVGSSAADASDGVGLDGSSSDVRLEGFEVGFTKSCALDTAFAASFTARRELSAPARSAVT